MAPLPKVPPIDVEVVRSAVPERRGFVWVREVELRNRYADGSQSRPYNYFFVERERLDAVCIVLYRRGERGPEMVLRTQLRVPLAFRGEYEVPLLAQGTGAVQWEVPAGLMEPGERGEAGLFTRAAAETLEEVGYVLPTARFSLLGPATSICPGLLAEKLFFVCAEVLPGDQRVAAAGDGHPTEEHAVSQFVPIPDVLLAIEQGIVHDSKTEIAVQRLRMRFGAP